MQLECAREPVSFAASSALLPSGVSKVGMAAVCALDMIGEVPASRWEAPATAAQDGSPTGRRIRYGGFVHGAQLFDNGRFRISPAEAAAMDPQLRLLLAQGYEALHGGGHMDISAGDPVGTVAEIPCKKRCQ